MDDVAVAVVAAVVILSTADDRRVVGTFISETSSAGIIILLFVSKVLPVCAARCDEAGANAEQAGMMTAAVAAAMDSFAMVVILFTSCVQKFVFGVWSWR